MGCVMVSVDMFVRMYSSKKMIRECWSVLSMLFADVLPGDVVDDLGVGPGKQR